MAKSQVSKRRGYDCVTLVGVGLIGASLVRDLRSQKLIRHVIGFGRGAGNLRVAKRLHIIDEVGADLNGAVARSDLVILAAPVRTIRDLLPRVALAVKPEALVIDVGSTKGSIVRDADACFPKGNFVGCHPVAGRESSGAPASVRGLFRKRLCILTPSSLTSPRAVSQARQLWQLTGARVKTVSAEVHDQILAASSHLPQLVASALMNVLGNTVRLKELRPFIGNGLRDTTRIAASEPQMWTQILLENRAALLPLLSKLVEELTELAKYSENGDEQNIFEFFKSAALFRKAI